MEQRGWRGLSDPSRSVALEVLLHGPLSRSELARRLDLSPGSLTRLSRPLLDAGVLVEGTQPHETPAGRPARPLTVVDDTEHFVGVRLAEDHAWAVLTTLSAEQTAAAQAPLPSRRPGDVLEVVADLVRGLTRGLSHLTGVGVCLGGTVSDGTVRRAPFLGWRDEPVAAALTRALGVPAVVENDVVSLTTAENWFGVGRRTGSLAVVTLGVGVGLGQVQHGRVVAGPDAGVGLVGHLPLGMAGPRCDLGHAGCAQLLTDGSIRAQAGAALRREVSADELLDLVVSGREPVVSHLADDVAAGLGRLVAIVANTTTVPVVVISGEGILLAELLQHRVHAEVTAHRDPAARPLELVFRHSDGYRWARGAAAVAVTEHVTGRADAPAG